MGTFEDNIRYRAIKTILQLFLIACMYIPICILTKLRYLIRSKDKASPKKNITIVITGAKMYKSTLFMKWMGKAGYDIVLVETEKFWCAGSRFSKYVKKFVTVADAIQDPDKYVEDMVSVCLKNGAKIFIPVCAPATEKLDSVVGERLKEYGIQSIHAPIDVFEQLNDKHQFCMLMEKFNLPVPESFLVKSNKDVFALNNKLQQRMELCGDDEKYKHKFILKNIEYDPVHRLDLFTLPAKEKYLDEYLSRIERDGNAITNDRPWTVQRFIDGEMWSTCHVQINGEICFSTISKASGSCFNWYMVPNDKIKNWMHTFADNLEINGIFTNDFIVDKNDGIPYAIECNPRLGSQVSLLHATPNMADIIIGLHPQKQIEPEIGTSTFTTMNELFVLIDPENYADEVFGQNKALVGRLFNIIRAMTEQKDPIFDEEDMLPFFMINFFQMPLLLLDTAIANRPWKKLDFQIGKVVELGGY